MTDPTATPPEPSAGDVLAGRFRLLGRLGRGGFGDVWRAAELLPDGSTVREVALKLLDPSRVEADWAREAKVLAKLQHSALLTVYSAGVLPGSPPLPFVSMELLFGETLDVALASGRQIGWRRALHYARVIAGALDAIHAEGIVHLDVKPSNLLVERDGSLRLLDFGIAELAGSASTAKAGVSHDALSTADVLDRDGDGPSSAPVRSRVASGTPGFMAPEVLEGRPARAAADAYALGACITQMITGRLPQQARAVPSRGADAQELATWRAEVQSATLTGELDLDALAAAAPSAVVTVVRAFLTLDPGSRPSRLSPALEEVWERPFGVPNPPYLGLSAYGADAEGLLFGRGDDAARLAAELGRAGALVLQGASGSGKSSLAVAGVVPSLAKAFCDGCDDWVAAVVRPGEDVDGAIRKARALAKSNTGVVLVVDQLEEVATLLDANAASRFALSLARHAQPTPGLRVLATLREDFTTRVAEIGELGKWLESSVRFVAPPSIAAVRDIVVGPASLAGVEIDDPRPIVEEAVRELRSGDGRLPAVAFALSEWWATRRDGRLSAASWRGLGGVAGALARHADATLSTLSPAQGAAARDVLLRLVGPDATRVRVPRADLVAQGRESAAALDAFVAARLVAPDDDGTVAYVHEALLTAWPTLADWMTDERADRAHAAELDRATAAFRDASPRERRDHLLRGARLARAEDLAKRRADLALAHAELLAASQRRASREAWTTRVLVLTALATALGVVAFGAWVNAGHEREIRLREENLKSLMREADGVKKSAEQIMARYGQRDQDAQKLETALKACQTAHARAEQEHRAAQAARYGADTQEAKLVTFLQQWEHAYNLHADGKMASFYAPSVDWMGQELAREAVVDAMQATWKKSPSNRVLLGDIAVTKREAGESRVRVTREERNAGVMTIASVVFVVQGDKPDNFRIVKGEVERTITTGKVVGCRE